MTPQPEFVRRIVGRTVLLLPAILLVLLHAVALAVPPEPIHLPGFQDGADFDSLIQPLVLALSAVPVAEGSAVAPTGYSWEPAWESVPAAPPIPAGRLPQPRAPPLN